MLGKMSYSLLSLDMSYRLEKVLNCFPSQRSRDLGSTGQVGCCFMVSASTLLKILQQKKLMRFFLLLQTGERDQRFPFEAKRFNCLGLQVKAHEAQNSRLSTWIGRPIHLTNFPGGYLDKASLQPPYSLSKSPPPSHPFQVPFWPFLVEFRPEAEAGFPVWQAFLVGVLRGFTD